MDLGISRGCFRGNCHHSDHFTCESPALCARTCAAVQACRWWSFWPSRFGNTCWLRRHDQQRILMQEGVVGSVDCMPPFEQDGRKEPTLFDLAGAHWGIGFHHPAHQWDLVSVLESFGHLTPSQVQVQEPSALQRSALRFAQRAYRTFGGPIA
mmetsp:Transcript_31785/g.75461  ORF Transcript_31785/g.75461 Transcript_31785/m.75461 type:complete len:153 (-) Transcript_31785:41-499(-)